MMRFNRGWHFLVILSLLMAALALYRDTGASAGSADAWWNEDWPYRVEVDVSKDGLVSVNLDFTDLFEDLGLMGALLDLNSIRVVPYTGEQPGEPIPYDETYSTQFFDADTLNRDPGNLKPYWTEDIDVRLALDKVTYTQGTGAIKAKFTISKNSSVKTGFNFYFNNPSGPDWSAYETLHYDVWPEVNDSAIDQAPDLFLFQLESLKTCPISEINGPPMVLNRWNATSVSLKPYGSCLAPDYSNLDLMRFFVMVNRVPPNLGYFDPSDELTLWIDNFRLVDQDGPGEIRWIADEKVDGYYIYFDTFNHNSHTLPTITKLTGPFQPGIVGDPEAGGYFHQISGTNAGMLSIWNAPTTEKILQTAQEPVNFKALTIFAARGESESIQLVVKSPSQQNLQVSASALAHENRKNKIPISQINLFRVDYVEISHISDFYGRPTFWPDPLYPISQGGSVTFPADKNQPLWIRVDIPDSALPGTYHGKILIGAADVPYSLTVWNFSMPKDPIFESQIVFDWDTVMETYRGTIDGVPQPCYQQLENAISDTFATYRLVPSSKDSTPKDVILYSLTAYEINEAQEQQLLHGKRVWWGFTSIDTPPNINPVVMDRPGVEGRILPWMAWLDRVDGIYDYQSTDWDSDPWNNPFSNGLSNGDGFLFYPPKDATLGYDPCAADSNRLVPSIRLELLREGIEDYTYLWLLNRGKPTIGDENPGDDYGQKIISSRTVVNRIPTAVLELRNEIAELLEARQQTLFFPMVIH